MAFNKYDQKRLGQAGCYALLDPEKPFLELPLKTFSYDVEIVDSFAQVVMTQLYQNPLNRALDVQYIFPVHPNSTVTKLEVEFDGKKSQGVVMEKQEAKNEFEQQVKEGGGAALGEYNPLSRDIMKMMVGNIGPRQTVKITLTYVHLNSLACNTFYQFKLTTAMTPRYARGLHVQQLTFGLLPGGTNIEGRCNWSVNVTIRSSKKVLAVNSRTHKIKAVQANGIISATFSNPNELPDRDFILSYTLENFEKPFYSISNSDHGTTAAISFIPKYCALSIDDAYKQHIKGKSFEVDLDVSKGEYIFLLDRSGSMSGIRIQNAKRALEVFLRSLPEDSYFNILSFGSTYKYLFPKSVKNSKKDIDEAVKLVEAMTADLGGTEILNAIRDLIRREVIPGYPKLLFFLTDGGVDNVKEVLRFISKHTQYTRINSIGIGNGCSEMLIRGCAEKGKGYSIFIGDQEQKPEQKIIALLENTLSPVISNLSLEYNKARVQSIVPNPERTPYILKNDPATFFISFNGKQTDPFEVAIKYQDTLGNNYREVVVINPKAQGVQCKWLHSLVSYQKIQALVDAYEYGDNQEDRIFYVKNLDKNSIREEIIKESVKHQILTEITAFLCIDANAVDQIKKYNINNPKEKVNIKGMNPYDHVVNFVNEGQADDDDDGYIDECCIMEYEMPPEELKKIVKFQETVKVYRPMKMEAKVAGEKATKSFEAITNWAMPQKRLPYGFIMKKQEVSGAWTEDFLDSLWSKSKQLRKDFETITDKISYITFLVCQYLIKFFSSEAQFAMIIKKGKNYIEKHSKKKWSELEVVFQRYYTLHTK